MLLLYILGIDAVELNNKSALIILKINTFILFYILFYFIFYFIPVSYLKIIY